MELISVIVPVYKVEAYLDRCVASIVNQTYSDLEIILVDDGSPDNCGAMCDAWAAKDSRIRVIHKENGGLSDARNAGLALATGEYIAFVDSDDWVHPEYISKLYESVTQHHAELAACDIQITYEDKAEFGQICAESECCTPEQAIESLLRNTRFRAVAWNKLYHRSLLAGEKYPVGRYHEDEFFTYRILHKARRLAYVDAPLYFYFQRSGSIMSSVSIRHLDALDAYLERLRFLEERYPALYLSDKITVCMACVSCYRETLGKSVADYRQMRKRILNCRKKLRFGIGEIRRMPLKKVAYVIGSAVAMHLFCWLLNAVRRK